MDRSLPAITTGYLSQVGSRRASRRVAPQGWGRRCSCAGATQLLSLVQAKRQRRRLAWPGCGGAHRQVRPDGGGSRSQAAETRASKCPNGMRLICTLRPQPWRRLGAGGRPPVGPDKQATSALVIDFFLFVKM
ncbi:unnamed protein product [Urochloa humidicola]